MHVVTVVLWSKCRGADLTPISDAFGRGAIIQDGQQQRARLGCCVGAANRDLACHFACVFRNDLMSAGEFLGMRPNAGKGRCPYQEAA